MSSLTKALQTSKQVTIDGEPVEFPLIDIYDLSRIDESRKTALKVVAKRNATEQNLLPADIYSITMDIDARDFTLNEILLWAITPKGATEVLEYSLRKGGKDRDGAKKVILSLASGEVINLANELILKPRKAEKPDPNAVKEDDTAPPASSDPSEPSTTTTSTPTPTTRKASKKDEHKGFGD